MSNTMYILYRDRYTRTIYAVKVRLYTSMPDDIPFTNQILINNI